MRHEDEFIVVGYTAPAGSRQYFGALLLGAYDHGKLRYVGKVGTGFTRESLARLFRAFQSLVKAKPSLTSAPRQRNIVYLAPKLIAQVAFEEWTNDQKLRQPVFLGLRDDKKPPRDYDSRGTMTASRCSSVPDAQTKNTKVRCLGCATDVFADKRDKGPVTRILKVQQGC